MAGIAYQTPLVGDIRSSVGLRNGKAYPLTKPPEPQRDISSSCHPLVGWGMDACPGDRRGSAYGIMSPYWSIASASSDAAGPG
ncbi:hypothetical protein KC360_g172 [Hortaea werneckii]|nr:hypothetical protein KC360_g172 [Hortaea werneckii]